MSDSFVVDRIMSEAAVRQSQVNGLEQTLEELGRRHDALDAQVQRLKVVMVALYIVFWLETVALGLWLALH